MPIEIEARCQEAHTVGASSFVTLWADLSGVFLAEAAQPEEPPVVGAEQSENAKPTSDLLP